MPIKTSEQIDAIVRRAAGKGLDAAARFLANQIKEVLSIPAAPVRYKTNRVGKRGSIIQPRRAATPATPGAPPRKLTGRLRASVASSYDASRAVAKVGTSAHYGQPLEVRMDHAYLIPALRANLGNLARIIGGAFRIGGNV